MGTAEEATSTPTFSSGWISSTAHPGLAATVFPVDGHHNTQKVYIRHVLTHKEYDRGSWRKT
jgi:hypothetical protein